MQEPLAGDKEDDRSDLFGCGGIDLHGSGPKGPPDMGGLASLALLLSLPIILRRRKLLL